MNKILLILFFLFFAFKGITQDSLYVNYYLKGEITVYPYRFNTSSLNYKFENYQKMYPSFLYFQNERGEIVNNEILQIDLNVVNEINSYDSLKLLDETKFYLLENIPPFLDTVTDGKYKMFYNPIPYQDGDTLKFLRNQIAIIYEVKNNLINGESHWFTPFSQRLYKQGKYVNSKKEGSWWMENQKVITTPTNETFTQFYITQCLFKQNLRDGKEVNITCPADYNRPYNTTAIWDWKNDTTQNYTFYFDTILLIQGNNLNVYENEWTFWDWKIKPNEPGFTINTSNRYLFEHYIKNWKHGSGTIIRSIFSISNLDDDSTHFDYGSSGNRDNAEFFMYGEYFDWNYHFHHICGSLNNFYVLKLPNDAYFKYHEENILIDNYETLEYEKEFIQYSRYNQVEWNKLSNSEGYFFFYKSYERYYPNGQLFLKFKLDENGNLERENDTIYWESGLPMNIVRFDSEKNEYEQIIYDNLGNIIKHKLLYENGNLKKDMLFKEE